MNSIKTSLLMLAIFVLFIFVGRMFGPRGLAIALTFAVFLNVGAYWFSDKIILAMYGAQEVSPAEEPRLCAVVEELSERAGMPKPHVYVIKSESPNAFATGRSPNHAALAVTTGVMSLLSDEELRGVIGHELAHVQNRDILLQTIVAAVAGAITYLAFMLRWRSMFGGRGRDNNGSGNPIALLAVAILAPFAALLIQMWISRTREFAADEHGARLVGDPRALASALRKLELVSHSTPLRANPATAHMFIVAPFTGRSLVTLFSTHPAVEDRVARLEEMAAAWPRR